MSVSKRAITVEFNHLLGNKVIVKNKDNIEYKGVLKAIDESLNVVLSNAETTDHTYFKVVLPGSEIKMITLAEIPFDILGLRDEIAKVVKAENVRYFEDSGVLLVMDRFKVTEEGVTGEGAVAERIRSIWQAFKDRQK